MKRIGLNVPAQLAGKGYRVSAVHVPLGHVAEARTPIISFKSDIAGNDTKTVQLQDRVRVLRVICGIDDPLDGFDGHLMILEILPDDQVAEVSSSTRAATQSTPPPASPNPGAAAAAPPRAEEPKPATATTTAEPRKHEASSRPPMQTAAPAEKPKPEAASHKDKQAAKRPRKEKRRSGGFVWFLALAGIAGAAASYYFTGALVWSALICLVGLLFMGWGLRFMFAGALAGMMYFLVSMGPDALAPDVKRAEPQIVDELITRLLSPSVSDREQQEFERWLRS